MYRIRVVCLLVLALALLLVPAALADGPTGSTPSGAPAKEVGAAPGLTVNADFADLAVGAVAPACMTDVFGFTWYLNIRRTGPGTFVINGAVDALTGYLWDVTGSLTKSGGVLSSYFRADNPLADGCVSGFTDWFEYFGSGNASQSGSWTSYCSGSVAGSGTWSGTLSRGSCP